MTSKSQSVKDVLQQGELVKATWLSIPVLNPRRRKWVLTQNREIHCRAISISILFFSVSLREAKSFEALSISSRE